MPAAATKAKEPKNLREFDRPACSGADRKSRGRCVPLPRENDQSMASPLLSQTFLYQKKESFLDLEKSPVPSSCLLT